MLINLAKTFGLPSGFTNFSNLQGRVRLAGTNNPARLYTSTGLLLTNTGVDSLANSGLLSVWVNSGVIYDVDIVTKDGQIVASVLNVNPSGGVTPTQATIEFGNFAALQLAIQQGQFGPPQSIIVQVDETNDGARTLYFWDGSKLQWSPTVDV